MAKSQVVETVERDGRMIAVYDNGMERDVNANKIIRPPTAALITKATSQEMHRKRQDKAAAMLRDAIIREHNASAINGQLASVLPVVKTSAAAFAQSGALLYGQIVLNPEAYPRDRIEAWKQLGAVSETIMTNAQQRASEEKNDTAAAFQAAAELLREMRLAIEARETIHVEATDTRNE